MINRRRHAEGHWSDGTPGCAPCSRARAARRRGRRPVTLDVLYAFPAFAKFHEPIAQEFMKRQSGHQDPVSCAGASYDEGHQTMLRQAVTNQLPDVYYSGYHLLPNSYARS